MRRILLPALFLTPALLFVFTFFVVPVILTGVFSFTSMSTSTGIRGGRYVLAGETITELKDQDFPSEVLEVLNATRYVVSEEALSAAEAAGAEPALIAEMRGKLLGSQFESQRALESRIKELDNRPRSTRTLKTVAAVFETSIRGVAFESEEALLQALSGLNLALSPEQERAVARASYTGWVWTLENFRRLLTTPSQFRVLTNTLMYVFCTLTLFNAGFALVLAVTTFYLPTQQANFFRAVWLLPRITPSVIYVLLWKWFAWDNGFLSAVLGAFGVPIRNWMLDTPGNAWLFVILINGFIGASMGMIIFTSAMRAIPKPILYASEVDGASRWQQIRLILLPQLKWPILFITSYQTLSLLTSFEQILLATDGGPGSTTEVWALQAYHVALSNYAGNLQYGYGAALALVLVVVGMSLSLLYLRIFNFDQLVQRPRIEM